MGNELLKEDFQDEKPEDFKNDYIRYGIVSKKGEEKSYDDNYLSSNDVSIIDASKNIEFSLFGVFDGHNSDYVSKYLYDNIPKLYKNEITEIDKNNYKTKIENIFKTLDKNLKESKKYGQKKNEKNKNNEVQESKENNEIKENKEKEEVKENEDNNNENKEEIIEEENYINIDVNKDEFDLVKQAIKDSKDIPEEFKEIDDSELENLLLFKNLFKYNNNYINNKENLNYIGASASVVLLNEKNVITADLGITKCILFNKNGNILNYKNNKDTLDNKESKDNKEFKNLLLHTFNNPEEKKRIKKFNKSIDYNSLKLNFYVPASRCFGFFKYKDNQILKEENQIISCIPDICIYDIKDVDFILLVTKGASPSGESFKNLIKKIKELGSMSNDEEIKLSEILEEYIKNKREENEKFNSSKNNNSMNSQTKQGTKSNIYVGKEDFGEENVIINELNSTYYKDIMSLNKVNDCHGNYNATCILIQLLQKEKINKNPVGNDKENNPGNDTKKEENLKSNENYNIINEVNNELKENKNEIIENKDENKTNDNIQQNVKENIDKKEEEKEEEKKNENNIQEKIDTKQNENIIEGNKDIIKNENNMQDKKE